MRCRILVAVAVLLLVAYLFSLGRLVIASPSSAIQAATISRQVEVLDQPIWTVPDQMVELQAALPSDARRRYRMPPTAVEPRPAWGMLALMVGWFTYHWMASEWCFRISPPFYNVFN